MRYAPQSLLENVFSARALVGSAHLSSSQAHYHPKPPMNTFSRSYPMMVEPQIVNQYKQVPESSFFPLFTATNTRAQTSQNLYYNYSPSADLFPRREPDHFPRREPRMPQSLFDQMSSGAIFRGNPSYQNTVTKYSHRLYKEMPQTIPQTNLYTALSNIVVQSPFRQDHHRREMIYEVYIQGELSLCIDLRNEDFGVLGHESCENFRKNYIDNNFQIKPYGSNQAPENVVILNQNKTNEILNKAKKSFGKTDVISV